jgi:dTDP-4-amino-4,6-dideoxygalactose transaminase
LARRVVPFHRPSIGPEEEAEVLATLRSGWLTTGPRTKQFERDFASYVGAKHAVGLSSCTAALHLALLTSGVEPGDEVITSPITFAATANVIEHVGARPVFVDVESATLNIDPGLVEGAISSRTRAIVPVHFAGHPCDMRGILEIADRQGISVVEDAAHAVGASYGGRKIGSIGRATAFSFYATKNMTTGEGGMLTTDDDSLADRARILSLHGISRDAWKRYTAEGYRHWDILEPGFKYNMFDLQAALGLHQLAKLDGFIEHRRRWVERYDAAFADVPHVRPLECRADVRCAHHLYVLRFDVDALGMRRDRIMSILQAQGVGIGVHFRPVHLHPYYRDKYGYRPGTLPVAERAGDRCVSLPLFPTLTEAEVDQVIETVGRVVLVH